LECRQEQEILYSIVTKPALEPTQPPIYGESAALSTGVKGPEREADQKFPSTAENKNDWTYTYTPPSAFIARKEKISLYTGDYSPNSSLFFSILQFTYGSSTEVSTDQVLGVDNITHYLENSRTNYWRVSKRVE
jgi:hypothetical protein